MGALLLLLLAAPPVESSELQLGSIVVSVTGPASAAAVVCAVRDGVVRARRRVRDGRVRLPGLRPGEYDLYAEAEWEGGRMASRPALGVRAVVAPTGRAGAGHDAALVLEPSHRITVETDEGATVWFGRRAFDPLDLRLFEGLHYVVVDHPRRVSSPARVVRVPKSGETSVLRVSLDPGLVVLGRVRDVDGEPIAGASIEAFADGLAKDRTTLSGADGSFGLSGFFGDVVSLRVRAPGYASALRRIDFPPGSERTRVDIVLAAGSAVALEFGLVATAVLLPAWYERALEEPRLRANYAPEQRTGKRVLFSGLVPGRRYRVLVSAPGFVPASTSGFVAPPAGVTAEFPGGRLVPAASVHGVVSGSAGPGSLVRSRGPEGLVFSRADRFSRYELDGLDAGKHVLSVSDRDERGVEVEVGPGERATRDLNAAPATDRALGGIVMDADGKALAGVIVDAAGRRTVSGEKGAFTIEGLPPGREFFDVSLTPGPGCRALVEDPHLPQRQQRVRAGGSVRVPLRRAATLRLRFDTAGVPLARATLHVGNREFSVRRRLPRRAVEAQVFELPVGSYEVDVAAPGLLGTGRRVVAVRRGAQDPILLALARGRRAAGRVVLRTITPRERATPVVTDRAVPRGWVSLMDPDPLRAMAAVPLEEDGSFSLEGLPLSRVVLCAGAPGLPTTAVEIDLASADSLAIVIPLRRPVVAAVQVTGESERPLPDATVRILDMLRPDFGIDTRDIAALGRFRRLVADDMDVDEIALVFGLLRTPSGRIAARFLHPGSYQFLVSRDGYESVRVGVRARTAWQDEQIRKNLVNLDGVPSDLTTPIRLKRTTKED